MLSALTSACAISVVCNPDGPHTPFGSPLLTLFDLARVVSILAACGVAGLCPSALARCVTRGQQFRVIALGLWALQAVTTEAQHVGDNASIRLLFNLGAAVYGLYGMWRFRSEIPARSQSNQHRVS